jgi:regulator of protease activity HflC (stomatin/prohibitin superfamily)
MEATMDWNASTGWWLAAGVLVAAELVSGTFYLLMLALGCIAGALAAHLGAGAVTQVAVAALSGAGATAAWHLKRARSPRSAPSESNRDVNLDIGEQVVVRAWGGRRQHPRAPPRQHLDGPAGPRCAGHVGRACHRGRAGQPAAAGAGHTTLTPGSRSMEVVIVVAVIALLFVARTFKIVPQQNAWVVERLGKFDRTLTPGLKFVIPFIERVAYKHSLKEVPMDVPSQVCITKDNTQLQVDGILYFQVTDPMRASYGSSDYLSAITQLAQTTLRSVVGKMELDKTFEERDMINAGVVSALDEAAQTWGVKVLRYEIKDLTPPAAILHSMQAQITAEREKRALIAASEGRRQEQINIATGEREAFIARSEGQKQAEINKALGEAAAITAVAEATAGAIRMVADAIRQPGGEQAVQLKVAEKAVEAYGQLAQKNNTMIVPGNMSEVSALIGTAMTLLKASKA